MQRNPRVGYVQGHADVLCFLLGNMNDKRDAEQAFWVYACVIERWGGPVLRILLKELTILVVTIVAEFFLRIFSPGRQSCTGFKWCVGAGLEVSYRS
jgi:hypothetical protein